MRILAIFLASALIPPCFAEEAEPPCADLTERAIDAALGDSVATYNLAVEFYTGRCVKQSYENAAILWERAAASGVVNAKNNLGFLLSQGLGVTKDMPRAVSLWKEAALAGHVESQLHFGDALFHGDGIAQDRALGLAWVLLANELVATTDEPGAGPELSEMAADGKAEMLKAHPEVLDQAIVLKATMDAPPEGR
jgi:TPR repeat protein